jgi:hypothetical protein
MSDLQRDLGVRLLVALDHAVAVKIAQDVLADTEVIRASSEELEIVGTAEVALAARFVAGPWRSLSDKLARQGQLDGATFQRLAESSQALRIALRERHWGPEEANVASRF